MHYATVAVNATPGMDYTPVSGTLTFGDGVTSQNIVVPVLANPYDRTNELVNVVLSDVSPCRHVPRHPELRSTLTIVNTDPNTSNLTVGTVNLDREREPDQHAQPELRPAAGGVDGEQPRQLRPV